MIKRVALSTILAAGLYTLSAAQTMNNGPVASSIGVQRTDDPTPCPDCSTGPDRSITISRADLTTDDPTPCPDCPTAPDLSVTDDPTPCPDCSTGPDRSITTSTADLRTDDPTPCPDCSTGPDRTI